MSSVASFHVVNGSSDGGSERKGASFANSWRAASLSVPLGGEMDCSRNLGAVG